MIQELLVLWSGTLANNVPRVWEVGKPSRNNDRGLTIYSYPMLYSRSFGSFGGLFV